MVSDWLVPVIVQTAAPTPMLVVVVAALFVVTGSVVADAAVAVFVMTDPLTTPAFTFTTSVNVATADAATLGLVQPTVPVPPTIGVVQVHPAAATSETNVVLAGVTSLSTRGRRRLGSVVPHGDDVRDVPVGHRRVGRIGLQDQ
jgi:hypothetical protein